VRIEFDKGSDILKQATVETKFGKDDGEDKAEEYSILGNKSDESGLMPCNPCGKIQPPALLI